MSILIFFIVLLVLVLVHEFGHFFAAKRFGIRVDEFGFGFPPRLFGKKWGETEYTFNLLPIGGFVKIFGENPDEESISGGDKKRSMVNKPKWQQAIVLFAGVFSNFILAWILFSISLMLGLPTTSSAVPEGYEVRDPSLMIISVVPGSPAQQSGLEAGDKITKVESVSPEGGINYLSEINPDTLKSFILSNQDTEISLEYKRSSEESLYSTSLTPEYSEQTGEYVIGIAMGQVGTLKLPVLPAIWEGFKYNWNVTGATAVGLYTLIADSVRGEGDLSSITGPVGMVGIVGDAYEFGLTYLLSFTALISIHLAIINLAPFPALDGGRLLFLLIEKLKGSRLSPVFANGANIIGFALLIILMLFVTYQDILNLIK